MAFSRPDWPKPLPEKDVLRMLLIEQHLDKCTKLKAFGTTSSTSSSLGLEDADYHEAEDLSVEELQKRLEALRKRLDQGNFSMIARDKNAKYRVCKDGVKRLTVEDINKRYRPRADKREKIRKVVEGILQSIQTGIRDSNREVYYQVKDVIDDELKQKDVYEIIDDICCDIMCTTSSIYVDAVVRGMVGGRLSWKLKKSFINYEDDGMTIPRSLSQINDLHIHDARFVLVVEKEATFRNLMQCKFYDDYPCIIITGMGTPCKATRRLSKLLCERFGLPMYGFFDCDPGGIRMFTNYTVGTYEKAFDSVNLTCPNMTWLGIRPSDLNDLKIPSKELSEADMKAVDDLLKEDFVKENPWLLKELKIMKEKRMKANIEALKGKFGSQCLSKKFLPCKMYDLLTN